MYMMVREMAEGLRHEPLGSSGVKERCKSSQRGVAAARRGEFATTEAEGRRPQYTFAVAAALRQSCSYRGALRCACQMKPRAEMRE